MKSDWSSNNVFSSAQWVPSATLNALRKRADLVRAIRRFFDAREVLEVETPVLSQHATVDRHIESFQGGDGRWLQTSPEFAMKRLLCSGAGAIWQLCKAFRLEEAGRQHNPEFTLLEWYRPGFDHHALMDEVEALLRHCGADASQPFERLSYREAFLRHAGFDPLCASISEMRELALQRSPPPPDDLGEVRDDWLDHFFGGIVSPALGLQHPCFVYDFPASQAALSRVRGEVAERFELIWRGVELANGFHELADADEQAGRFEKDLAWRRAHGRAAPPADALLIAALRSGLPDCAGVALGVDRLLMLLLDAPDLASTLAFDWPRA
ncbi:MAG: EF-P lysine aminoacylase EpmA [Pseudomonadota bacterium]